MSTNGYDSNSSCPLAKRSVELVSYVVTCVDSRWNSRSTISSFLWKYSLCTEENSMRRSNDGMDGDSPGSVDDTIDEDRIRPPRWRCEDNWHNETLCWLSIDFQWTIVWHSLAGSWSPHRRQTNISGERSENHLCATRTHSRRHHGVEWRVLRMMSSDVHDDLHSIPMVEPTERTVEEDLFLQLLHSMHVDVLSSIVEFACSIGTFSAFVEWHCTTSTRFLVWRLEEEDVETVVSLSKTSAYRLDFGADMFF